MFINMGRIFIRIDDDLERKFRIKAVEKYGGRKGCIGKAVEEAIKKWLEESEKVSG